MQYSIYYLSAFVFFGFFLFLIAELATFICSKAGVLDDNADSGILDTKLGRLAAYYAIGQAFVLFVSYSCSALSFALSRNGL